MRRRRRQNQLLAKTILIGVVVAALVLPILAKLGLFKQLHQDYVQTQLVNLPPPPQQPQEKKPVAKKAVKSHVHAVAHHGPEPRATRAPTVSVHVAAAKGPGASGTNEPAIVNNATGGPVGQVPAGGPSAPPAAIAPPAQAPPPPTPPIVITPPAPVVPAVVEAEPVYQPQPVLPDDLLDNDIDTTFYAYFTIHADGSVEVKMVQSTGNSILDRLAIDAAKQWKFTPATKNGIPVDSYRRLQVEFVVS